MPLNKDVPSGKISFPLRDQAVTEPEYPFSIVENDRRNGWATMLFHKGCGPIV